MFTQNKDNSNIANAIIFEKESLHKELIRKKMCFKEDVFKVLNKVLNLEEPAYMHFKLFKSLKQFEIIKLIYEFNIFYMTLNFIKNFFEKNNLEFKCTYNKDTNNIHLSYKNISLLSICYSDTFLTAIYYFSQNLEVFLENACDIVVSLHEKSNYYEKNPNLLTYDENIEFCKFILAQTNHRLFCDLKQSDIDIINRFYNEYILFMKIDLNITYKGIPVIATYDLSYPGIIK